MSLLAGACHLGSAPPEDKALFRNVEGNDAAVESSTDGAKVKCNIRKSIPKLILAARKLRMEYGSRLATMGNFSGKEKSIAFLGTRRESFRDNVVKSVER